MGQHDGTFTAAKYAKVSKTSTVKREVVPLGALSPSSAATNVGLAKTQNRTVKTVLLVTGHWGWVNGIRSHRDELRFHRSDLMTNDQ
jgi:siroheme synthase